MDLEHKVRHKSFIDYLISKHDNELLNMIRKVIEVNDPNAIAVAASTDNDLLQYTFSNINDAEGNFEADPFNFYCNAVSLENISTPSSNRANPSSNIHQSFYFDNMDDTNSKYKYPYESQLCKYCNLALENGDIGIFSWLWNQCVLRQIRDNGFLFLHVICKEGHFHLLKALIYKVSASKSMPSFFDIDWCVKDDDGRYPIEYLIEWFQYRIEVNSHTLIIFTYFCMFLGKKKLRMDIKLCSAADFWSINVRIFPRIYVEHMR